MGKLPVSASCSGSSAPSSTSAECWLTAACSHHTVLSRAVDAEVLADFAEMAGVEFLLIGADTTVAGFKKEIRWNEAYYSLARGSRRSNWTCARPLLVPFSSCANRSL